MSYIQIAEYAQPSYIYIFFLYSKEHVHDVIESRQWSYI